MSNDETNLLRDGIRSGMIDCPINPRRCDRNMAQHSKDCPWQQAIEQIYRIERGLEGANQ